MRVNLLPRVIFEQADGSRQTCAAPAGDSVMDCALDHGVRGLVGQCGGGCTCGTCHCYVAAAWVPVVPPAEGDELELLEYLPGRRPESRLACRIALDASLDGLTVRIPANE